MDKNILIDQNMIDYIFSHTERLHPIQKKILKYNEGLGHIKKLQISILQANFLQFLIKVNKFKSCLEIGTFTGYSSLSMALSLPKNGKYKCYIKSENDDKKMSHIESACKKIDNNFIVAKEGMFINIK